MALKGSNNAEKIWNFLLSEIGNKYGVAGLMGNLKAESNLIPTNLQNSYEKKFNMNDQEYTAAVDNGTYTNFVRDAGGYGLAQWTYWSRKQNLYDYCKKKGASIGDLQAQLEFLVKELKGYTSVWKVLTTATSVREASNSVLLEFERPANQGKSVQDTRTKFGEEYYNQFVKEAQAPVVKPVTQVKPESSVNTDTSKLKIDYAMSGPSASIKGTYVTTGDLWLRTGAGTDDKKQKKITIMKKGTKVRCYGYYTMVGSKRWLLVELTNGQTGFCSSAYLKRG